MSVDEKRIVKDGWDYYYSPKEDTGLLTAYELRQIANKIDEMNQEELDRCLSLS